MSSAPGYSIASSGMCIHDVSLSDPCMDCLRVSEVGDHGFREMLESSNATVHVECALCENLIEVRTGCAGIDEALSAGWEIDGGGELICPGCTEARADLVGEER